MNGLPKYMLRTDKGHNTVPISQTCLPSMAGVGLGSIAGMSEQITYASYEEMEKITKGIALGVSSRGTGIKKDTSKIITEDVGLTKEEMKSISKRFAMKRYLGTIDNEKEKDDLISNYDRAMKFIL